MPPRDDSLPPLRGPLSTALRAQGHNATIEAGFAAEQGHAILDMETRVLKIAFNPGSAVAFQRDEAAGKERLVRRTIKTAQELWAMMQAMQAPVVGAFGDVPDWQAPGTVFVPHDYFCPITQADHTLDRRAARPRRPPAARPRRTPAARPRCARPAGLGRAQPRVLRAQDVMRDPVKTCDGHTYDRAAILQWFTQHDTSPLTGLSLPNKDLAPNDALKAQIDAFLAANPTVDGGGA